MDVHREPFVRVTETTVAAICNRFDLSSEGRKHFQPELSPQGLLGTLLKARLWTDAVRFLAFALPIDDGVGWAVICCRTMLRQRLNEAEVHCLDLASQWSQTGSSALREECLAAANALGLQGAAAYAALAAYWSVGTAAAGLPMDGKQGENLGQTAVGASVLLCVGSGAPMQAEERFRTAILRGMDIADGGDGSLPRRG